MSILDLQYELRMLRQEVNQLKNRVEYLEKLDPTYGKTIAHNTTAKQQYQSPWSESYNGPNGYFSDPERPFP